MKSISNYRDFTKNPNSLIDSFNNVSESKKLILNYLNSFKPICASGMWLKDEIDGSIINIQVLGYSDGEYLWDTREIYHFEKYDMKLNDDFIKYVLSRKDC